MSEAEVSMAESLQEVVMQGDTREAQMFSWCYDILYFRCQDARALIRLASHLLIYPSVS